MKQAVLVFAIALVITLAIGPAVINYLRKMKFGQKILEIGPKWHMNKQNIPTMGGFMFIIGIAAAVIIGNIVMGEISVSSLAVLGLAVAYGAVGLVDDYAKIKKKENAGLTPKQKLVLQILVAGVFVLVLFLGSSGLPQLWIPFTSISFSWPWPLYIVFAAFVIVAATLTASADFLTPQQQMNGRYGYVNPNGRVVIRARFDDARPFREELAAVQIGNKWGFIDLQGKTVVKPQFDEVEDFNWGYAIVRKNGLYGAVNSKGELEIPCDYATRDDLLELKVLKLTPEQVEKLKKRMNK